MSLKTIKEKKAAAPKNGVLKAEKVSKSATKKKDVDEDDLDEEEEVKDDWERQKKMLAGIPTSKNLICQKNLQTKQVRINLQMRMMTLI